MYLNKESLNKGNSAKPVEPKHKMYLNFLAPPIFFLSHLVEPKHKMYLNSVQLEICRPGLAVEPKHKMYLNNIKVYSFLLSALC